MHATESSPGVSTRGEVDALIERGNALIRQRQAQAALACYRAALALAPNRFEVQANLGSALLALGRLDDARPFLLRALEQRPDAVPLQLALARACAAHGCLAEAESGYRAALALAPDDAAANVELAGLLRREGRFDEAAAYYLQVLAIDPRQSLAHYGLGHCRREQGRAAEAAQCFERAIETQPDNVDAHYRLAVLRPHEANHQQLAQLESMQVGVAGMAVPQQVRFWFALGSRYEAAAEFDAAFAAYAEGNRLQCLRLRLAETYLAHEASQARFVERIRDTFSRAWLQDAPRVAMTDPRVPVFIVGMPRSGTSLVEQMLAAHPAVHDGGEMPHLPRLLEERFRLDERSGSKAYPEALHSLAVDALAGLGAAYLERAWSGAGAVSHVTDKLTGNFLHAGLIHLALPRAKIVHVLRDPRDACFSCYANLFKLGSIPYSYDLGALGRHSVRCSQLMRHWHEALPSDAITCVQYEELVANPEPVLRGLLEFLGLPWDARCLEFHRRQRAVHTVSAGQVQQQIYRTSVARWQHFGRQLKPLLDILEGVS